MRDAKLANVLDCQNENDILPNIAQTGSYRETWLQGLTIEYLTEIRGTMAFTTNNVLVVNPDGTVFKSIILSTYVPPAPKTTAEAAAAKDEQAALEAENIRRYNSAVLPTFTGTAPNLSALTGEPTANDPCLNDPLCVGTDYSSVFRYGPEGNSTGYACYGFDVRDNCKTCCGDAFNTAATTLGGIALACHIRAGGLIWGHVACGVAEAIVLGAFTYMRHSCNGNCEQLYSQNLVSVDFHASTGALMELNGWQQFDGYVADVCVPTKSPTGAILPCVPNLVLRDLATGADVLFLDGALEQPELVNLVGLPVRVTGPLQKNVLDVVDYRILSSQPISAANPAVPPLVGLLQANSSRTAWWLMLRGGKVLTINCAVPANIAHSAQKVMIAGTWSIDGGTVSSINAASRQLTGVCVAGGPCYQ